MLWLMIAQELSAQTDTIRYVRTSGNYSSNGRSWSTATNSVQDAINDLRDYIRQNNLQSGSVYIAEGTYIPSESTESTGGSLLNTSFKIYEGIHIYGGFSETSPESSPDLRKMANGKTWRDNWNSRIAHGTTDDEQVSEMWNLRYKTILSGSHSTVPITVTFDSIRGRYNMTFPANSYHVVWFATNGEIPVTNDSLAHHYLPLERKAWIDGCTIYGGNASSRSTLSRNHTSYGGGAYMVANSELRNCIVSYCSSSLRGGGVYMDGGGRLQFCYVHTCQTAGIGIVQGYGGGVCIDYDGSVEHSYITQSAARIGGAMSICHVPGEYPWRERIRARYGREPVDADEISNYSPFVTASVMTNCTSNAEGGAIYLDEGGVINHCTVVRNNCIGPDVMYYGRRHGRSGGVYIRNCGMIYNSVFWGNTCKANNDIQFASVKQRSDDDDLISVYHTAFMNHDITDWTNVQKDMVFSLNKRNIPVYGTSSSYPCFSDPTPLAGILCGKRLKDEHGNPIIGPTGIVLNYPYVDPESYNNARAWHPLAYTSLAEKGVQVTDAIQGASEWIYHAHTTYGVIGNTFEPVSTLGALVRSNEKTRHELIVPQGLEARRGETAPLPTLFVDPNREGIFNSENEYYEPELVGISWDAPLKTIGDALSYFRQYIVEEPTKPIGSRAHYHLPSAWDENGNPTAYTDYNYVQILVKEGLQTTAGPGNYLGNEMRTASIRVASHMRIYAAYPGTNTGKDTEGRNPRTYITRVSANIMGQQGESAYSNNAGHVLTFVNTENAIVDGFRLYHGNAHHLNTTLSVEAGGSVLMNNQTIDASRRIDMVGNELRNCVLANCSAPKGAAIYVNGEHLKSNGEASIAELSVVNTVVRNNTADYATEGSTVTESHGVITANGRAFIQLNHCTVVNNVGFPFKADNRATNGSILPHHGYISVDNTIVFANGDQVLDNRDQLGTTAAHVMLVNEDGEDYVYGHYNQFDHDAPQSRGFKDGFSLTKPDYLYSTIPDVRSEQHNTWIYTRNDRSELTYPVFVNPARNVGHSTDNDKPLFGGTVSYLPLNANPCVNAADPEGRGGIDDYDRSDVMHRNYGGAPDIGAIENNNLPKAGAILYVTPNGAGKRDGSSWSNAIAGNAVYAVARETTDTPWNITGEGTLVLTTDSRYSGGRLEDNASLYPYGEKSNFSKPFWDPSTGNTHNNTARKQIIKNNRDEDYVSGLQYAVEKASAYNMLADDSANRIEGVDSVQVWVGNGTYTDIKGYVMRNKTSVLGGFPITTYSTPGLTERIALLAQGIHKPNQYEDKDPADYETILQVSDKSPQVKMGYSGSPAQDLTAENGTTDGKMYRLRSVSRNMYLQAGSSNAILADLDILESNQLWQIYTLTDDSGTTGTMLFSVGAQKFLCINDNNNVLTAPSSITTSACMWNISDGTISRLIDASKFLKANDSGTNVVTNGAASDATRIQWELEEYVYEEPTPPARTETIDIPILTAKSPFAGTEAQTITANGNSDGKLKIIRNVGRDLYAGIGTARGSGDTKGIISEYTAGYPKQLWQIFRLDDQGHVLIYNIGERKFIGWNPANGKNYNLRLVDAADLNSTNDVWYMVNDDSGYTHILRCGQTDVNSGTGWGTDEVNKNDGIWSDKTKNNASTRALWEISDYNNEVYSVPIERIATVNIPALNCEAQLESSLATFSGSGKTIYRKPVLFMPDVCLPTWSPSNYTNTNDDISNTYRVDPEIPGYGGYSEDDADPLYMEYTKVVWDGFTIRHGYYNQYNANRDGGAGVRMFRGATLQNCVVRDNANFGGGANTTSNTSGSKRARGGGIYMDSYNSKVVSCYVVENYTSGSTNAYGGGAYMIIGTSYNSLYANNTCTHNVGNEDGSGVFLEGATFYNNTIAYNNGIGICHWTNDDNRQTYLEMYNCIIYGNTRQGATSKASNKLYSGNFKNNYIQNNSIGSNKILASNNNLLGTAADDNPFEAANPLLEYDFRLKGSSKCVNAGISEPYGENGVHITLPPYDVAYTARVQDCQVDIGAHEYDGSKDIRPDTLTHPGKAIFYISHAGSNNGLASGDSPQNAACGSKIQKVLDAAGRYKYALLTNAKYQVAASTAPEAGKPNRYWDVQVRFSGDSTRCTDPTYSPDYYAPVRSTKYELVRSGQIEDNTLDYSFIVPHGVQLLGGYSEDFVHYEDSKGNKVAEGTKGALLVDERDPLTFRTVFSGLTQSVTGAEGKVYHVVTFTNDLFNLDERLYTDETGHAVIGQLAEFTDERDRAVIDGIFIEDGFANSPDEDGRIGAAAIVPEYAHIRNCVIQNNEALRYGGGLYLLPRALVSGSIIKNNSATIGGGIYVEEPLAGSGADTYVRIISSTICENSATTSAGGLWFDTNVRANSSIFWKNESNDFANVAGQFTSSEIAGTNEYPFAFCGVEVRRIEGNGNVELSATETEGVRWDHKDPFNDPMYYPIEMSSTLARAGMNYVEWRNLKNRFLTLDSTDIAGISRLSWSTNGVNRPYYWKDTLTVKNNDFIEIGARAVNRSYVIEPDLSRALYRLYVVHTELLQSDAARALQDNTNTDELSLTYRQMGSSFLNPFHRLGDAFSYIANLRKKDPQYRNRRFEVFLEMGEYTPYRNAHGEEDQVRTNTFSIPEGVTLIGSVNHQEEGHNYCQAGYFDKFTMSEPLNNGQQTITINTDNGTFTLNNVSTEEIKSARQMTDYNQNSVIEPWEFERQSILSGNVQQNDINTHVYHIITCYTDSDQLGALPLKYRKYDPATHKLSDPIPYARKDLYEEECEESKVARTIIIDGVKIQGGYANKLDSADYENHAYQSKTYFRGGGIFVDGNWTHDFDMNDGNIPNVTDPAPYNIQMLISNCQFYDNMAANGGAIYSNGDLHIFSTHFTQNYAQGPMTELGQSLIPWSAGGCIATNAYCGVTNCLFDNNESKRGDYPIIIDKESREYIEDADTRQGFAGVISAAIQSKVRAINCHFVKNKAVAYPAIFNFRSNSIYHTADSMHFAFNCIFWGNEATGIDKTNATDSVKQVFNSKYSHQPAGIMHYDKEELEEYRTLYNQYTSAQDIDWTSDESISKLLELRKLANKIEGIYFSAYEDGLGLPVVEPENNYFILPSEAADMQDYRAMPITQKDNGEPNLDNLFTTLRGNHNVIVASDNSSTAGMHFVQPSTIAGTDGYMDNADWLMSRLNATTDRGWGFMRQQVSRNIEWWEISTESGDAPTHYTEEEAAQQVKYRHENGDPTAFAFPVYGTDTASFIAADSHAMYNFHSKQNENRFSLPLAPVGAQHYMSYTREGDHGQNTMLRISSYPKNGEDSVFIDMGIYEYQYVQLKIPGNEIDTMWVTAEPRPGVVCDGTSWERATDRLQDCIDMLLRSYNNHDKYICILGGNYAPQTLFDERYTFKVSMSNDHTILYLPDNAKNDYDYYIPSISFLGGWSTASKEEGRDLEKYPTIIQMRDNAPEETLNQIFSIEDMTRHYMQRTFRAEDFRRDSTVIPIAFDGITFINPHSTQKLEDGINAAKLNDNGGAAIYYRFQRQYIEQSGEFTPNMDKPLYARKEAIVAGSDSIELPKLTISNCIFMANGQFTTDKQKRSSALRIDQGGGESLIVNSLFHSNAGAPVFAPTATNAISAPQLQRVPNKVRIINSTFALNDGHITLGYNGSELHNSIVWKDDAANDTLTQIQIADTYYQNGSNQIGNSNITHNAVLGLFGDEDEFKNQSLIAENSDVFLGPNFVDPKLGATTYEDLTARNFHINPAVRTMNMADSTIYKQQVFVRQYPKIQQEKYFKRAVGVKQDIKAIGEDIDLANKSRLHGDGVERGAYECQAILQRVLYVQPTMPAATAGDGSSWLKPLGHGELQNAIDVAAVYTYLNGGAGSNEARRSYVFVKGSYDIGAEERIIARDGVQVYGGIPNRFSDTVWLNTTTNAYENAECARYINHVRAAREGVASPDGTSTKISGISVRGNNYNTGFLLDGFEIIGNHNTDNEAAVMLDDSHSLIRNCLITNNSHTTEPIVDIKNGLLYNALIYGNDASTIVRTGANGLMLNCTVIATNEQTAIDSTNTPNGNILNCISEGNMFAPYLTANNVYTLPSYLTSNPVLGFQLHEQSKMINGGTETLTSKFDYYTNANYINFSQDRDVLGNPRLLGGKIDKGAMETWRIEKKQAVELTTLTNSLLTEDEVVNSTNEQLYNSFTQHFGGNMYPHAGSVVYLMDSSALTMAYEDAEDFSDMYLRPGYMLLKQGASFYGNGHLIQLNYLAAEKRFTNQRYSMTSFPFDYYTNNITSLTYNSATDLLTQNLTPLPINWYQYNGQSRSSKDYVFSAENSASWTKIDTLHRSSTEGYLMDFNAPTDTLLRFTSYANTLGEYVYQEDSDDKFVYLTQYDNRQISDDGINFTREEDMGWNMKGLPWLVSSYRTDTVLEEGNYLRQMYIPHVLYQMDGSGQYLTTGDQIYTSRSWDKGNEISFTNAFLTQTATSQPRETIVFHLPYYQKNTNKARPLIRLVNKTNSKSDIMTVIPDSTASKTISYNYGKDGIKFDANTQNAQLYLLSSNQQTRISLLSAAPTEVNIPLGVKIPETKSAEKRLVSTDSQNAMQYTFSLPEPDAYIDYRYVWLIDYKLRRTVNLLKEDYTVDLEAGENNSRFALRIGGFPLTNTNGNREYIVFAHNGMLYVRGVVQGDKLKVYSPTGQILINTTTNDGEYSTPLLYKNSYIVLVNDYPQKVINL